MKHQYRMKILEHHLDTFGHVNHATYLEILEEARWDLIEGRGYGLEKIKSTGVGPIILEASIQYRRELLLRETIVIESQMTGYERRIGTIYQEIKSEDLSEVKAVATLKVGLFDTKARKLIAPTYDWLHAIGWEKPLEGSGQ